VSGGGRMSDVVEDIKEIIAELVAFGNDHLNEVRKAFGDEILKNSLALIINDVGDKFGFMVRGGRFRMIEGDEVNNIVPTAVVSMPSGFFNDLITAIVMGEEGEWEVKVWEGYQTYKIQVTSVDGVPYIHYKNLMSIVKWLYNKLQEAGDEENGG